MAKKESSAQRILKAKAARSRLATDRRKKLAGKPYLENREEYQKAISEESALLKAKGYRPTVGTLDPKYWKKRRKIDSDLKKSGHALEEDDYEKRGIFRGAFARLEPTLKGIREESEGGYLSPEAGVPIRKRKGTKVRTVPTPKKK